MEDLKSHDLLIVDIPTHEMSGDLVVMTERRRAEEKMGERLQVGQMVFRLAVQFVILVL